MNDISSKLKERVLVEPFSQKFKMSLTGIEAGYARVEMDFTPDMENIFGLAHGGAIYALMDEAFQVASNSHGIMSVALNVNVTYHRPPEKMSHLIAEARETAATRRTASYNITVTTTTGELIASCQALVYRTGKPLPFFTEG
ncbi:MAG TPA: PaaI family thioesterase [Syntrophales bacterium]|nr:PaaI family thioesterase [Syntrophales bacterium]HOL59902.1 PaaI family thioesterase [Syntrophales bacterium]HPO36049.1 PaaI family thioesterase [Syntrophales bacterium]